jgi:hypothetical protein
LLLLGVREGRREEGGWDIKVWQDRNVLYLDCGDGYTNVPM